jgi:hypothetical protein
VSIGGRQLNRLGLEILIIMPRWLAVCILVNPGVDALRSQNIWAKKGDRSAGD